MEEGAMAADNYYNCPPGFRFYPTEEELLSFYLRHKLIHFHNHQTDDVAGIGNHIDRLIPLVDIYRYNPWDLPQLAAGEAGEQWFFFSRMQEREARGGRPKRVAGCGYWKATGTLGYVYSSSQNGSGRCIGEKRTMVFYTGKAPKGRKTDWKFNEYKACSSSYFSNNAIDDTQGHHVNYSSSLPPPNLTVQVRHELSVIRVYKKSKCLRSFDRRPIITTMNGALQQQMEARRTMTTTATFNTNNNNNNNQHIISCYYNMNPADQLQPQPQPQQQQQVVPYLPPTSYNLEAFNYYRPTTAAAETDLPGGQKYPCHDDQPPLVAAPRVEYLSSTGSTDWSLSPPQEMAADDDEETATTSAFSGCVEELDWYH